MKIIKTIIMSLFIITILSINTYALEGIVDTAEQWELTGINKANTTLNTETLNEGSAKLYNIFVTIGIVVALIVGAFLGIKYMSAGVSEKVQVKESLFPYIVSCIVVFGSLGIWKICVAVLGQISK